MMYFINEPTTYRSVNNKGLAMNKWISTFTHTLVKDELSLDAFIQSIRTKALMLDKEYHRTIPLHVYISNDGKGLTHIQVFPKKNPEKLVFALCIYRVRGEFRFSESIQIQQLEGGLR